MIKFVTGILIGICATVIFIELLFDGNTGYYDWWDDWDDTF